MEREKDIWIIEECSNPSTEYYILPALKISGFEERTKLLSMPPEKINERQVILIFIRYLTRDWLKFIEKNREKIKRIVYFMDDDLFDLSSWRVLPLRYVKKIYLKAYRWKEWLIKNRAVFFVSTDFLAQKYQYLNPLIIPPYPIFNNFSTRNIEKTEFIKVFYHGTASHKEEFIWLYEIVKAILMENDRIIFEIVGNKKIHNKFKDLKGVIVVHPMKWELYKKFLLKENRHIGLAPLLSNKFNLARNYTKFFEIVACGAVGVYSKESCYFKVVSNEYDGILLSNKKEIWIERILELAADNSYRLKLYSNSLEKFKTLKEFSEKIYKENLIMRLE